MPSWEADFSIEGGAKVLKQHGPVRHRKGHCSGKIKAEKTLDFSIASTIYQLLSLSNVCKEIYVVRVKDSSIENLNQWMENVDGATDWSYVTKRLCHLEGKGQDWQEKEEQLKSSIKGIYKWEQYETSDLDPSSVPEVDCVISLWMLKVISKSKEDFQKNLRKITFRLKIGGHLVLFHSLNMSFFWVGNNRYRALSMDETELQESVIKAGLVIEESFLIAGSKPSSDMVKYSHVCAILARKAK
ncbi:indolethylamine N-methyltransferase-like [Gastrophryne carolinensis]